MFYEVKNTALNVPLKLAFDYISNPKKLPVWTHAFTKINEDGSALMSTPEGEVIIQLEVISDVQTGTVDWRMVFSDGSCGTAHSRLVTLNDNSCLYSFILTPPPVPLEMMEEALKQQGKTLEQELILLKSILEK